MAKTKRPTAIGTVLTLTYGTSEIVGYAAPWRTEIYRPTEVHSSEPWNREIRERIMATGPDDTSTRHSTYPTGYDSRCSCCYLNISHTVDKHAASLASAPVVAERA